jgi:two-component system, NtrC family, response regulator HydG
MSRYRILVLDDDIGVCTVLSRILEDQQYDVHTSQSVSGAAETLVKRSFDAYLLDYRLQDGTGLQVAEQVRERGSNAPIILISGYGANDLAAQANTFEIFDVVQKPFTRETICDTLDRALRSDVSSARPSQHAEVPENEPATPSPWWSKLAWAPLVVGALFIIALGICVAIVLHH